MTSSASCITTPDLKAMVAPFTKWSTEIYHVADIPLVFRRAFKMAKSPPMGPVFISLPVNVQRENIDFKYSPSSSTYSGLRCDYKAVDKAAELFAGAKSPIMIVGWGVTDHDAVSEVVKLAELTGARVYKQWMADMDFPGNHRPGTRYDCRSRCRAVPCGICHPVSLGFT